jgi:hypothetical protein
MSQLPLLYPEGVRGEGRRVVLRVFKDQENAGQKSKILEHLASSARKVWQGQDQSKEGATVILADIGLDSAIPQLPGMGKSS